jgi:hypothetical protein
VPGRIRPGATGVVACHTRQAERLAGPQPGSPRRGRHGGALTDGSVVASRWQGVTDELVGTTRRAPGKEGLVGLIEGGDRLRGGVAAWCDGARWGPHRREGRRRRRLAPGAVGEDGRGKGGPSLGNGGR